MNKTKSTKTKTHAVSSALARVQSRFPNVTKVVDATKSIDIEVTKTDTQSKAVRNHSECALAQACKRALAAEGAIINITTAYLVKGDTAYKYQLPETVSREITTFDREAGFAPGEYHLKKPAPSHRLGVAKRSGTRKFTRGNGQPQPRHHITHGVRRVGDLNT